MRLSVALCTRNGAGFLPAQLASVAAQSRPPDEVVACDDGSSDETVPLLHDFARSAGFPVRVVVHPVRRGSTENFSQAVGMCSGDVIALCDQDDWWEPHKLRRIAAAFADESVGLAFSDARLADENLRPTGRTAWDVLPFPPRDRARFAAGDGPRVLLRYNVVPGAAMAVRADLRDVLLPIPGGWVHDAWMAFVAAAVSDARPIPEPLVVYRRHAGQQIGLADRTLTTQVHRARTLRDAAHFERLAAEFDALADRLEAVRDRLRDAGLIGAVRAKAAFARERAALRGLRQPQRTAAAAMGWLRGDYGRFARGWPAAAADAVLG